MKPSMIIVLLCISLHSTAQKRDSLRFLEFSPIFTNKVNDMPFETRIKGDPYLWFANGYATDLQPLNQSFYTVGLLSKWYSRTNKKALLSFEMGYAYSRYEGSFTYTHVSGSPYFGSSNIVESEKIITNYGSLKVGFARAIFIDSKQRLVLMPDFLFGFEVETYDGTTQFKSGEVTYDDEMYPALFYAQVGLGGQMDIKLNYRLNEYVGLGLTLRNVLRAYGVSKSELDAETNVITSDFADVSIGKVDMPRLSLIWYLKPKRK